MMPGFPSFRFIEKSFPELKNLHESAPRRTVIRSGQVSPFFWNPDDRQE